MTNTRIHWSELDDKFWINDRDEVLWFESSLEAKDALREIEVLEAVNAEVDLIVAWLLKNGIRQTAGAIESRDYRK